MTFSDLNVIDSKFSFHFWNVHALLQCSWEHSIRNEYLMAHYSLLLPELTFHKRMLKLLGRETGRTEQPIQSPHSFELLVWNYPGKTDSNKMVSQAERISVWIAGPQKTICFSCALWGRKVDSPPPGCSVALCCGSLQLLKSAHAHTPCVCVCVCVQI